MPHCYGIVTSLVPRGLEFLHWLVKCCTPLDISSVSPDTQLFNLALLFMATELLPIHLSKVSWFLKIHCQRFALFPLVQSPTWWFVSRLLNLVNVIRVLHVHLIENTAAF